MPKIWAGPPSPLIWKKSKTFAFPKYVPFLASRFQVQPQIVGGLVDGTSGTLTAPDLDLNMEVIITDVSAADDDDEDEDNCDEDEIVDEDEDVDDDDLDRT